jgi:cytochrome c5
VNQEDKQFMIQFSMVLGALLAFTVVIFFLARFLMSENKVDYEPLIKSGIEQRIRPVGGVSTGKVAQAAPEAAAPSGGAQASGQQTFDQACSTCHTTGTAGAPKVTDKAAWQPRIKQGKQTLYKHAINGLGVMPPKGGQASLSDAQVKAAVDYIVAQVSGGAAGAKQQPTEAPAKGGQKPVGDAGQGAASAERAGKKPTDQAGKTAADKKTQGAKLPAVGADVSSGEQSNTQTAPADKATLAAGKKVYESTCSACHGTGAAGAPRLGDKAAWASHLKEGKAHLYQSTLNGTGAMPPKGGNPSLSAKQVKAAVDYMVNAVQ